MVISTIGCRRRRPRKETIDFGSKRDVKIVDEKKESIIIKDRKVSNKDARPIVEVEKPELSGNEEE